ncbi:hypothetical protein JKP88DRAFT_327615 [Tribonema minus]|uniref:Uncharacterized protein n=1 Tax=Tribonema minus TaxID=303371 RepID=A0A836CAE0_9STRA|nr:hypothetical protein JKP88DRAFT_327615 [Tribonema minus]
MKVLPPTGADYICQTTNLAMGIVRRLVSIPALYTQIKKNCPTHLIVAGGSDEIAPERRRCVSQQLSPVLCLACASMRIVACLASIWCYRSWPLLAFGIIVAAYALDVWGQAIASSLRPPAEDDLMCIMLAIVGDRATVVSVVGTLVHMLPLWAPILICIILLDQASALLQAAASWPRKPPHSHCGSDADIEFAAMLQRRAPLLLMSVCAGNEAFLLWLYFNGQSGSQEASVLSGHPMLVVLAACCAARQALSAVQVLTSLGRIYQSSFINASCRAMREIRSDGSPHVK